MLGPFCLARLCCVLHLSFLFFCCLSFFCLSFYWLHIFVLGPCCLARLYCVRHLSFLFFLLSFVLLTVCIHAGSLLSRSAVLCLPSTADSMISRCCALAWHNLLWLSGRWRLKVGRSGAASQAPLIEMGDQHKHAACRFSLNLLFSLLKIDVWKSRKHDRKSSHFAPSRLNQWRHKQGGHGGQKYRTRREPTFLCSSAVKDELESKLCVYKHFQCWHFKCLLQV